MKWTRTIEFNPFSLRYSHTWLYFGCNIVIWGSCNIRIEVRVKKKNFILNIFFFPVIYAKSNKMKMRIMENNFFSLYVRVFFTKKSLCVSAAATQSDYCEWFIAFLFWFISKICLWIKFLTLLQIEFLWFSQIFS